MQPSPFSLLTYNNQNLSQNLSKFWPNGGYRKRKIDESDVEDKTQRKIFLTEEKLIKNMQTLSLDLSVNNNDTSINQTLEDDEKNSIDNLSQNETRFELHQLLKDNLRKDDLQDKLINKLYDLERKKLSMQIVPYIPIHPAQLNNNNQATIDEKNQENKNKISSSNINNEIKKQNDDHIFKRPFSPTPYTVEEPCENTNKRPYRMKRSYSQSVRSNNNLSVVELKDDTNDYSIHHPQSDYFIVEPTTPVVVESPKTHFNSLFSSNRSSIQITEYFDFSSPLLSNDNNINMQTINSFDINDKMDEDI